MPETDINTGTATEDIDDEDFPAVTFNHYPQDGGDAIIRQMVAFGIGSPSMLLEIGDEGFEVTASVAHGDADPFPEMTMFLLYIAASAAEMLPEEQKVKVQEALASVGDLLNGDEESGDE